MVVRQTCATCHACPVRPCVPRAPPRVITVSPAPGSLRNSRRCWRRGGAAAKREGGWAPSPRRFGSGRGDFSPFREGPSACARTTSPHPPRRSLGSPTQLIMSAAAHLHISRPEYPSGPRALTARAAPCLADRDFFATTFDFLASAPNDGQQLDEPGYLQLVRAPVERGACARSKVRQSERGATDALVQRLYACVVPCVAWEERRLSPHDLEIGRHGCTCAVQCRR